MSQTVEATFDGSVFRPTSPVSLPVDAKVRLTVENLATEEPDATPQTPGKDDPYAILKILSAAKISGPPDWSENLDHYLYGPYIDKGESGGE
jgi:hypothetical protein